MFSCFTVPVTFCDGIVIRISIVYCTLIYVCQSTSGYLLPTLIRLFHLIYRKSVSLALAIHFQIKFEGLISPPLSVCSLNLKKWHLLFTGLFSFSCGGFLLQLFHSALFYLNFASLTYSLRLDMSMNKFKSFTTGFIYLPSTLIFYTIYQ